MKSASIALAAIIFVVLAGPFTAFANEIEPAAKQDVRSVAAACPEIYAPICGRPVIGAGLHPTIKTYSNPCFMKADSAIKLHNGMCDKNYPAESFGALPVSL